ncbi:MAG: hypothetical protein U0W24_20815 [Bacteroidales bacterium]
MNLELVKLDKFSGEEASIYTLLDIDVEITLFDKFVSENKNSFESEIKDILMRLNTIGKKTGAREQYFTLNEGKPGDLVCAIKDQPDRKLRLYCIRYGKSLIILGGGGPKTTRTLQEDPKLTSENEVLLKISDEIYKRLLSKDIFYTNEGKDFEGELEFEI